VLVVPKELKDSLDLLSEIEGSLEVKVLDFLGLLAIKVNKAIEEILKVNLIWLLIR
jgi:hypothetical protein